MTRRGGGPRLVAVLVALAVAAGMGVAAEAPALAAHTLVSGGAIKLGDSVIPTNPTSITINDAGSATPYPSDITVTNEQAGTIGSILDVNVVLTNFTHATPTDVDMMLVGPGGQQATLMSDSGGVVPMLGNNLVIDDEAAASFPSIGVVTSGSYRPTNYDLLDSFPAPAPLTTGATSLSTFDGLSSLGTWRLFVVDDFGSHVGAIAGGWALDFAVKSNPYPSAVSVANLPAISDLNVNLQGLSSTYPGDIDLLLVGPGGQQATLISDVGGTAEVNNLSLTLDDEAATGLPDAGQILTGAWRPTNLGVLADPYPEPAPAATGSTSLSVFDGLSPQGTWLLFAVDDTGNEVASLTGWSLDFTWADAASPNGVVTISGGAPSTSITSVTLGLAATDPAPASGVSQMRFSNNGITFSAYQPYAATTPWMLTAGDGMKTVYAQFKDADGNESAVANDTITLAVPDTTGPTVTKTTPKKNAKNVKVTTKVKVKVSEALKGSTVTKKTVFLKAKGSSDEVKAKVTYNSSKKMIVLTPNKALKSNKKYNVTVTTKVKDVAGNAFDAKPGKSGAQALKFSFTTA